MFFNLKLELDRASILSMEPLSVARSRLNIRPKSTKYKSGSSRTVQAATARASEANWPFPGAAKSPF